VHTLVLGSRLNDRISVYNDGEVALLVGRVPEGLYFVSPFFIHQRYRSVLNIYTAELQQIWQQPRHNTIVGARFQTGDFDTRNVQFGPYGNGLEGLIAPDEQSPVQQTNFVTGFERTSVYGYQHWEIAEPLLLIGGVSYDRITFPENFRAPPVSDRKQTVERISPKAGLIWRPWKDMTLRGNYTRSLSGASIDQSSQLEPTQVAGFLQSFRSITPESIGGSEAGARFETYGVSLEQKFPTGTYLGVTAETLHSQVERTLGVFELDFSSAFARLGGTRDDLDYEERTLLFTFNQLLSDEWSLAARYRLSHAVLRDRFVEALDSELAAEDPAALDGFRSHQRLEATLHQLSLDALFHHRSGFFAQGQALWYLQSNRGYAIDRPGDEFLQFNLFAGYRFPRRRAEILIGLLNVTDQDYRLNPLTLYNELPRERTLMARFQFNF